MPSFHLAAVANERLDLFTIRHYVDDAMLVWLEKVIDGRSVSHGMIKSAGASMKNLWQRRLKQINSLLDTSQGLTNGRRGLSRSGKEPKALTGEKANAGTLTRNRDKVSSPRFLPQMES